MNDYFDTKYGISEHEKRTIERVRDRLQSTEMLSSDKRKFLANELDLVIKNIEVLKK